MLSNCLHGEIKEQYCHNGEQRSRIGQHFSGIKAAIKLRISLFEHYNIPLRQSVTLIALHN